MNHRVPILQIRDSPIPFSPEYIPDSGGQELEESDVQELVWRNGKLTRQSYNQKSPFRQPASTFFTESEPFSGGRSKHHPPDFGAVEATLASDVPPPPFFTEDEMASWLDHYPLDDALSPPGMNGFPEKRPSEAASRHTRDASPQSSQKKVVNFSLFARPARSVGRSGPPQNRDVGGSERIQFEATVVDSCETPAVTDAVKTYLPKSNIPGETMECCKDGGRKNGSDSNETTPVSCGSRCGKRKTRESDGSESHIEIKICMQDADADESMNAREGKRSSSKRRNRSTETHNLSEQRRRDRINKKIRALRELLPQYNKLDKASLLDEAIEYLKCLQLQVQLMSMGYHMSHTMFPGHHSFMTPMAMAGTMGMVTGPAWPLMPFAPNMLGAAQHYPGLSIPQRVHHMPVPALCTKTDPTFNPLNPIQPTTLAEFQQFLSQLYIQVSPQLGSPTIESKSEHK